MTRVSPSWNSSCRCVYPNAVSPRSVAGRRLSASRAGVSRVLTRRRAGPVLASSRRAAVQARALASRTGAITPATQGLLPARPAPARASAPASPRPPQSSAAPRPGRAPVVEGHERFPHRPPGPEVPVAGLVRGGPGRAEERPGQPLIADVDHDHANEPGQPARQPAQPLAELQRLAPLRHPPDIAEVQQDVTQQA